MTIDNETMQAGHDLIESSGILIQRPEWIAAGMVIASHYKQKHEEDDEGNPVTIRYVQRYSPGSRLSNNPILIDPITVEFEVVKQDGNYMIKGAAKGYEESNTVIHTGSLGRMFLVSPGSDLAKLVCSIEESMRPTSVRQTEAQLTTGCSEQEQTYSAAKKITDALQTTQPQFAGIVDKAMEAYNVYETVLKELKKVGK